jgi:hypothetical protein
MRTNRPEIMKAGTYLILGAMLGLSGCGTTETLQPLDLQCSIPESEMFSTTAVIFETDAGGPGRDGIRALDFPQYVETGSSSGAISEHSRVLGIVHDGVAAAYPIVLLWWHEIVNDTVGGLPVLVSYCPLTGSGIAFDPRVDGEARIFGVSGLLYENNLIMFDRQTESLWNQMLLGAQCGPTRGTSLARVPVVETTWGQWLSMYPDSRLVSRNTGFNISYGAYPYDDYDDEDNSSRAFPGSRFSNERPPKELGLGVYDGKDAVIFPFGVFEDTGDRFSVTNDSLNGMSFVVTFDTDSRTAIPFRGLVIGQNLSFTVPDPNVLVMMDVETGSTWNQVGEAISGPMAGETLGRIDDSYVAFWFAWPVYSPGLRLVESLN